MTLAATSSSTTAAVLGYDFPLNIALPPGYKILVGLGTTVATGWAVTVYGGKY
jgi:hypothetical protein